MSDTHQTIESPKNSNSNLPVTSTDVLLIDDPNITHDHATTYPDHVLTIIEQVKDKLTELNAGNKQLKNSNWMTDQLEKEVAALCPGPNDIIDKDTGERSQTSFSAACEKLVPVGRVFASTYQLSQCLAKFLPQWACGPSPQGKCIRCSFSPRVPRKRNDFKHTDKVYDTPSNNNCPFVVRYSLVNCPRKNALPSAFYKSKNNKIGHTTHLWFNNKKSQESNYCQR